MHVVDADEIEPDVPAGFFDNIPHGLIENTVAEEIADRNVIS